MGESWSVCISSTRWDKFTGSKAGHSPKQPRGPNPNCKLGPALGSKISSPFSSRANQRSGMKTFISVTSHTPILSLALRLLPLRCFSSTVNGELVKLGPFARQKTVVPFGMWWPRISVSHIASRVWPGAVFAHLRISSNVASRYGM